jgi:hypothetical protein
MFGSRKEAEEAVAAGVEDVYERWDYSFVKFHHADFGGDLLLDKEVSWGCLGEEWPPRTRYCRFVKVECNLPK